MNLVQLDDGADGAVIRGTRTAVVPGRGAGLTLGVRPEHVNLLGDVAEGVPGTVTSAEYHGADTIVTAKVGEEQLLIRAPGQLALAAGAPVRLGWDPAAAHLFDSKTGVREAEALQPALRVAAGG
jgi:sn-glycerol 3-phosphate transport system ATP-binding protein